MSPSLFYIYFIKVGIKHKGPVEDIRSSIDEDWRHCLAADITLSLEPQTLLSKIKEMKTNRDGK